jgi:hypothetical protein
MATQARVTSTDALENFRASLIVFQAKARRAVNDVGDEVRRTRLWLQHDQRIHCEGECRRWTKALQQAEQELMSVRLTGGNETARLARQAAVNKAKRSLEEAEGKLRRVKAWTQNFDGRADPVVKRLEALRQYLETDLPKASSYLIKARDALEAYAMSPALETATVPAASPSAEPEGAP